MANRFSVEAVFKAVDKITAPVSRMQNKVGKFSRSINRGMITASKSVNRFTRSVRSSISTVSSLAGGIKSIVGTSLKFATGGFLALGGAVAFFTSKYSVLENAQASFQPLLGGLDKARKMVKALNVDAEKTPFRFETLAKITKTLLPVMQGDIEKTRQAYKMLGDTAGGNAFKLESITRGYTKALLKGKVDLESLNMIAEAGVPIVQQLAKSMGRIANEDFLDSISKGQVQVKDLTNAFVKMTSKGGLFFNGMKIASETTAGRWSTFLDAVDSTSEVIGKVLNVAVKEFIIKATEAARSVKTWVENNEELLKQNVDFYFNKIKDGIRSFVVLLKKLNQEKPILDRIKDAISSISDAIIFLKDNFDKIKKIVLIVGGITAAFVALKTVILAINIASMMNPWVLAITGIVALLGVVIANWKSIWGWFSKVANGIKSFVNSGMGKFLSLFTGAMPKEINTNVTSQAANQNFSPKIVSPQERNMSMMQSQSANQTEITIKDDTGRAEITKGNKSKGAIKLQSTGTF